MSENQSEAVDKTSKGSVVKVKDWKVTGTFTTYEEAKIAATSAAGTNKVQKMANGFAVKKHVGEKAGDTPRPVKKNTAPVMD